MVNLPTIFASGEPESVTTEPFRVLGFSVVVTATAHWDWTFDREIEQGFDKPGGAYPNDDVSYTYASAGERDVSLTTTWDATFTIDPLPTARISGTTRLIATNCATQLTSRSRVNSSSVCSSSGAPCSLRPAVADGRSDKPPTRAAWSTTSSPIRR